MHKIISLYQNNLPQEVINSQRKVFEKFGIELEQICFEGAHADAISNSLNRLSWDSISIFDVDCIPITKDCIDRAKEIINDTTIYGNAQSSNTMAHNVHKSPPYAGPMFLNFNRKLWETSVCKNFNFRRYPNPEGFDVEADVAEVFSRENEKQGRVVKLAYPTHCYDKNPPWENVGKFGWKPFKFGRGMEYESGTYHNFQIRFTDAQQMFIDYCNKVLAQ